MTIPLGNSTLLADALTDAYTRAAGAWPTVALPFEAFDRHVRAFLGEGATADELARLGTDDLYVACACVLRVAGAVDAIVLAHGALVKRQVGVIETRADVARDVVQNLYVELLVGAPPDGPPKIVEYSGRGPLRAWLRMAASRRALNARRDVARFAHGERQHDARDDAAMLGAPHDPELAYVKAAYPAAFASALRRAIEGGTREERALLRLHYLEGVTMDGLAVLHGWGRASAHRRLAAARAGVLARMERLLEDELRLAPEELQSLLRAVRSRLHVSLAEALAGDDGGGTTGPTKSG